MKLQWFKHDLCHWNGPELETAIEAFITKKISEGFMPVHCAEKPLGKYLFREMTKAEMEEMFK